MLLDANGEALPPDFVTLRDAEGRILIAAGESEGAFVFKNIGRKIQIEFAPRSSKSHSVELVLIDAPRVFLMVRADPATGQVKEITQKPLFLEREGGKVRGYPSGGRVNLVPPSNDSCATPLPAIDGPNSFTNVDATTDGLPPGCTGTANIHKDVWFDYVATATGTLTAETCNAASFDTKVAIYTGLTCPPGTPIGCNDDGAGCSGFTSRATAPVVAGMHYLIRVGGFSATTVTGTGTLTIIPPAPPPLFDDCATAQTVACGSATMFNNSGGTTVPSDPAFTCRVGGSAQGFGTSWFQFMATGTSATIDTNGSSTGDTLLAVYSGTCGAFTQLACDDDSGTGALSMLTVMGLTVGQTYYIQVAGFGSTNVGNNVLNVACGGAPQGDSCMAPVVAACGSSTTLNLATLSTDPSDPAFSCRIGGAGQGVGTGWISFVATHTSAKISTNASTGASDTLLALYDGSCGALIELCCDDDNGTALLSEFCCEGLTVGNTYLIQVAAFSAATLGSATVTIECPCPAPPANDECEDAIALGVPPVSATVDTTLATDDIGMPCGVASGPFSNVWYSVTGTGNTLTATTCNPGTVHPDTKISVFCGDCLEPVCVTGNDDDGACGFDSFFSTVSWCTQPGVTYLVTVGGFSAGQVGTIELSISDDGMSCEPLVQCLPIGACCLTDGSCVDLTQGDCMAAGGTYQGDGTACLANLVQDPSFEDANLVGFVLDSPDWTEASTNFTSPLCSVALCGFGGGTGPRGAGLNWSWFGGFFGGFEEGSIEQTLTIPTSATTLDFYLEIPISSGNGVDFLEVSIDGTQVYLAEESDGPFVGYALVSIPLGGFADGGSHTIEFHSIQTGTGPGNAGTGFSNFFVDDVGITTVAVDCPQPLGACCLPDGSCVEVTEDDCTAMGGMFNGDFSLCMDVTCPQPLGACCLVDGSCVQVTEEDCTAMGGSFDGDFTLCVDSMCPQPAGACCLMDGSCVEVTEEDCAAMGGMFNGDFSLCANVMCEQPIDCFVLDFEADDQGNMMVHGTKVDTEYDGGANFPVTITGSVNPSGSNTAAILNSTTGPALQDPDLLVGCGNILILQTDESLSFCAPGVYCTHNDDEDGGTLSFAFNQPTTPASIVLIDIDAGGPANTVVLTDVNGATRTYTVPANWTGDRVINGNSGKRTLDLTTLANQPGFGSTATASQMGGFDATAVIRIVVTLTGSGAVDDLSWCQDG